jgi:hypothetical protein
MPARTSVRSGTRPPLVVTGDPDLLDDLLRLAAAAGVEVDLAPDPAAARARWTLAPLVLVGGDQAKACLEARLPHRRRLVVVGRSDRDGRPGRGWEVAELIGAEHVAMLPAAEPWLVDTFGPAAWRRPPPAAACARCWSTPIPSAVASTWCWAGRNSTARGGRPSPAPTAGSTPRRSSGRCPTATTW